MAKVDTFWDIRFTPAARRMYSQIPRGEADQFAAAVQILRKGPNPSGVEQVGKNLYKYSANGYRVSFEIAMENNNTVRVTFFERIN